MCKISSIQFLLSRLRTKLIFLIILAVIPALGLTFYITDKSRREATNNVIEETLRINQLVFTDGEESIERTHQILITLTGFPEAYSNNSSTCNTFLEHIRKQYSSYTIIGLIDSSSYASCSSPPIQSRLYLGDRPYYRQVISTRKFAIGNYQIGRITSKPSINFGYPILSENGKAKAVIYVGLALSWLDKLAAKSQLPSGSLLTFIDRDGNILARNPNSPIWLKKSVINASFYQTIMAHKGEGTDEIYDSDGVWRLYVFRRLRGTPDGNEVYVSLGIPSTIAFANSNRILAYSLSELGLVVVLALVAVWFGSDVLILQQVYVLLDVTKRLNAGDLKARTAVTRGQGEMAELAISFDTMAASLEKSFLERQQIEQQLLHNAYHDQLTQLPNRALFIERLTQLLKSKRDTNYLFAVLFLDFDRFKVINDSLGHFIGDQLLIGIARRLETCLNHNNLIARLGGDEFTILVEDIQEDSDATKVADKIRQALTLPFVINGHEIFTSVSIGITLSRAEYNQPEELLRDADTAMYKAKSLGKAQYQLFSPNLHFQAVSLLQLETDLQRAINYQQFRLYYQPIVLLENLELIGFEALLRWQHPQQGIILPVEFIPVAEETRLIIPIGEWVLKEACHQLYRWQKQFSTNSLSISINISGNQFLQLGLINQIKQVLQETGLNPCSLKLEITESVMMDAESAIILSQLKSLGLQLHIDDFGTGFSSLNYLHCFPVDALKIDRSFISRMGSSKRDLEIVSTIVTLANKLKIDAIAEGIETTEQLTQLQKLSCTYGQGYLFAKPLDSNAANTLIASELENRCNFRN